jgi:hypothetical protein
LVGVALNFRIHPLFTEPIWNYGVCIGFLTNPFHFLVPS